MNADWSIGFNDAPSQEQIAAWERIKRVVSLLSPGLSVSGFPEGAVIDRIQEHGIRLMVSLTHAVPPPIPGVVIVRFPFDDSLSGDGIQQARDASLCVAEALLSAENVLVHCMYGLNRAPFVAALAMHRISGLSGEEIYGLIRRRRIGSLHNPAFATYIRALK